MSDDEFGQKKSMFSYITTVDIDGLGQWNQEWDSGTRTEIFIMY